MVNLDEKIDTLIALMSDLSEELWCAGWLLDCEHLFWRWIVTGFDTPGLAEIKALSDEVGGWAQWKTQTNGIPSESGPVFVSMSEWEEIHAAWKIKHGG